MKYLILLCLLVLAAACEENVESYDDLTPDEQAYIRERASIQCLADSENNFTIFKDQSNSEMAKYKRGDFWKITIPGVTATDFLYVWKVTGSTVYFLYQQKLGSVTNHNFIKMTPGFNSEMIDDLRIQKCKVKVPAITASSNSFTVKYLDTLSTEGTTRYRTDTTYSGNSSQPAFYSLFKQTLFKEKLNTNGDVVSSENLTYAIAYENQNAELLATYAEYSNKKYCVFKYNNVTPKTFLFPFELNCVDNAATNANPFPSPTGDATLDFTAAEL